MVDIPEVGDPVAIRDEQGRTYRSRVEDVDADVITVAQPVDLPVLEPYIEGDELLLTWTRADGVSVLAAHLAAVRTERTIRLWDLLPTGQSWTEQRREHVRVPAGGTMIVQAIGENSATDEPAEPPLPLKAQLVDVSEAALRCTLAPGQDDEGLAEGVPVSTRFSVRGSEFEVPGVILRRQEGERPEPTRLIVRFEHSERVADALRKEVFAVQLEMRRSQRG
jgi:c-di-GMP-binding flagellar brake protein YcgR